MVDVFGDSIAWTLVHYLPGHPELDVRDRTLMGCGVSRTAPFRYFNRHYPEDQPQRVTEWNQLLRGVASRHPNVRVVEFGERVSPGGRFTWTAGGYQVRSDGLHLTPSGVQGWMAPWLMPQLVGAVPK